MLSRFVASGALIFAMTIANVAHGDFIDRGTVAVANAIGKTRPGLTGESRKSLAKIVIATSREHNIDPFTIVAIAHNESRWNPSVVSADGEDFGLGQVRARYIPGCRRDIPAAHDNSPSCAAVKSRLLSHAYGIAAMGNAISKWRTTCRKITKRPANLSHTLHGYGGMGKLGKTGQPIILCGRKKVGTRWVDLPVHKAIKKILDYRKALIRQQRRQA